MDIALVPSEDDARQMVDRFARRFGDSYRFLACHAALPLILTPELVHYLRNTFLRGQVPWVAEIDLLLSDLCRPVGYEQYAMDQAVRAFLIAELRTRTGERRLQDVARLLISYVRYLSQTDTLFDTTELDAQQLAAMVCLDDQRDQAIREIAGAFRRNIATVANSVDNSGNKAELARLAHFTETLAPQLSAHIELVEYANLVRRMLAAPEQTALEAKERLQNPSLILDQELPPLSTLFSQSTPFLLDFTSGMDYRPLHDRPLYSLEDAQKLFGYLPTESIPEIATLPPGSRVPSRLQHFVGRLPDLWAIATALKGGQTAAIRQAIAVHGIGGAGKTSLANEFSHRYGAYFAGGVYWLSFADPANILFEVAQCGGKGGMQLRPDFESLELEVQVAAVQRAWAEDIPRLLVFDNVDTDDGENLVQQWRPATGGCRVLITSRRGVWDATLGVTAMPLGVLPRAESIALLRQFRADLSDADAGTIAAELGDLPLALHLAASFLKKYARTPQGNPAAFLARLRDQALLEHPALQGRATGKVRDYHELSVAQAFALSYERLQPDNAIDTLAQALLARAAHFAPGEAIPRNLLLATVLKEENEKAELDAEDAFNRLIEIGLLEHVDDDQVDDDHADSSSSRSVTLHKLLAEFARRETQDLQAQDDVETALLNDDLEVSGTKLLPHLYEVTRSSQVKRTGELYNRIGRILSEESRDSQEALKHYFIALEEARKHSNTILSGRIHVNIGTEYDILGDLDAAREHFLTSKELFEEEQDFERAYCATYSLGITYMASQPELAVASFLESLKIAHQSNLPLADILLNLGTAFLYSEAIDQARYYIKEAQQVADLDKDTKHQCLYRLGEIELAAHSPYEAYDLAEQARKYFQNHPHLIDWEVGAHRLMGEALIDTGNLDQASIELEEVRRLEVDENKGEPFSVCNCYYALVRLKLAQGNADEARRNWHLGMEEAARIQSLYHQKRFEKLRLLMPVDPED